MNIDWKKALSSAGIFVGVLLVMCLAVKLIIHSSAEITDGVVRDISDPGQKEGGNENASDHDGSVNAVTGTASLPDNESKAPSETPMLPQRLRIFRQTHPRLRKRRPHPRKRSRNRLQRPNQLSV